MEQNNLENVAVGDLLLVSGNRNLGIATTMERVTKINKAYITTSKNRLYNKKNGYLRGSLNSYSCVRAQVATPEMIQEFKDSLEYKKLCDLIKEWVTNTTISDLDKVRDVYAKISE